MVPTELLDFLILIFSSSLASALFSSSSGSLQDLLSNALGRLLFIGVWGWVSDTWQSLIGDTCHSLIGPLMSSLTRAGLLVSLLTRARPLVSSLTHALMHDWFLHDTWIISVGL